MCSVIVTFNVHFLQDFCRNSSPFPTANESRSWPGNPPSPFLQLPNSTALIWAPNITAPACWPPLSALRLFLSPEASSCVKTCQDAGLICEPAYFPFINNMEAFNGWETNDISGLCTFLHKCVCCFIYLFVNCSAIIAVDMQLWHSFVVGHFI